MYTALVAKTGVNPLRRWLGMADETQKAFAERSGLAYGTVRSLIGGHQKPGRLSIMLIEQATDGAVTGRALLRWYGQHGKR